MTKREELISKFERNKALVAEFRSAYNEYLEKTNNWDEIAFHYSNSPTTNRQYYNELVRVSDLEYSDSQHEAIKTITIQDHFLGGYIEGIDTQYKALSSLYEGIKKIFLPN